MISVTKDESPFISLNSWMATMAGPGLPLYRVAKGTMTLAKRVACAFESTNLQLGQPRATRHEYNFAPVGKLLHVVSLQARDSTEQGRIQQNSVCVLPCISCLLISLVHLLPGGPTNLVNNVVEVHPEVRQYTASIVI